MQAYQKYVLFINLLRKGFLNHGRLAVDSSPVADPATYELLNDLQSARESMSQRFALGEDLWADWIEDQIVLARTLEAKISVRELCERALAEESTSTKLWLLYGHWMLTERDQLSGTEGKLSVRVQSSLASAEERSLALEIFGQREVLNIWRRGAEETMWRLHDSHRLWDPYTDLLSEDMGQRPKPEVVSAMRRWFQNRLQTPHATWDQTSSRFSTFVSTHDNANWETTMVNTNRLGADAKRKYELRDSKEISLLQASQSGDVDAELTAYRQYLDFELDLNRQKNSYSFDLAKALFQRATLRFPANTELWEAYAMFLREETAHLSDSDSTIRNFLETATRHCPWSGALWSQLLIAAEIAGLAFSEVEDIKHKATSSGILELGEMSEALKTTIAWCGYLRRRAFLPGATDEDVDVAEVGIRSAIEDLETIGTKKFGKDYAGDPNYRLEAIYITYLTKSRNLNAARDTFRKLIRRKGHDYEFWLRYYNWEMMNWSRFSSTHSGAPNTQNRPIEATKVLQQAIRRTDLNWPEKIIQVYLEHCEDYEDSDQLQKASVEYYRQMSALKKRREQEMYEQYAAQQQQQQQQAEKSEARDSQVAESALLSNGYSAKRKADEQDEGPSKKLKSVELPSVEEPPSGASVNGSSLSKRDRENTTILVRDLPADISETKVKQFFRDVSFLEFP